MINSNTFEGLSTVDPSPYTDNLNSRKENYFDINDIVEYKINVKQQIQSLKIEIVTLQGEINIINIDRDVLKRDKEKLKVEIERLNKELANRAKLLEERKPKRGEYYTKAEYLAEYAKEAEILKNSVEKEMKVSERTRQDYFDLEKNYKLLFEKTENIFKLLKEKNIEIENLIKENQKKEMNTFQVPADKNQILSNINRLQLNYQIIHEDYELLKKSHIFIIEKNKKFETETQKTIQKLQSQNALFITKLKDIEKLLFGNVVLDVQRQDQKDKIKNFQENLKSPVPYKFPNTQSASKANDENFNQDFITPKKFL